MTKVRYYCCSENLIAFKLMDTGGAETLPFVSLTLGQLTSPTDDQ
jgi:hypothetical protein